MGKWYAGSGIMHQKFWIFASRHLYLGSANMDWKSIAQVKEMGVAVKNCPALAEDTCRYLEVWFSFSAFSPSSMEVFDPIVRIYRKVPLGQHSYRWINVRNRRWLASDTPRTTITITHSP